MQHLQASAQLLDQWIPMKHDACADLQAPSKLISKLFHYSQRHWVLALQLQDNQHGSCLQVVTDRRSFAG